MQADQAVVGDQGTVADVQKLEAVRQPVKLEQTPVVYVRAV